MRASRRHLFGAALAAAVAGCGPVHDKTAGAARSEPLAVGVIRPRVGDGARFEQGLRAGLAFATSYTGLIGTRRISVTWMDDGGDPDRAAAAAEALIGRGVRLIAGGVTGESALRLAAIAGQRRAVFIAYAPDDRLTGLNRCTFRCGRQTSQDLAAARTLVPAGARLVVVGPDPDAARALGAAATAPDPAGIARTRPDLLFVSRRAAWRGIPDGLPAIGVLGARSTWATYPASRTGPLRLVSSWVDGATRNSAGHALRIRVPDMRTDTGHPEGFAAAQMIVRALQHSPADADGMVAALEGARFASVKGELEIRAADHALLQPMFRAALTWAGASGSVTAVSTGTLRPGETAPPR
jgi:branched-chain amino acid transport system substrate-binding protein